MKREEFIPVYLGFLSKTMPRWLAEEDTIKGHIANIRKMEPKHDSVLIEILERSDGKGD